MWHAANDDKAIRVNTNHRENRTELGQTAVLFALMLVGLVGIVGLAVDGGVALNERRITQNAADASVLGGAHYLSVANAPTEQGLMASINQAVEANGISDTDGTPSNHINDNVVAYYTDSNGKRLVSPNCNLVGTCGGTPPLQAFGVEVEVNSFADTFFMGVLGIDSIEVAANAIAASRGQTGGGIGENVMFALGEGCDQADWPLAGRANDSEFLGGLHSNSWFVNSGEDNHYHFEVTYLTGFDRDNVPANETFEPTMPFPASKIEDPFAGLKYTDFAITGTIGSTISPTLYFDVSVLDEDNSPLTTGDEDGIIEMREIINQTLFPELYNPDNKHDLVASDGVVLGPNQLRTGLYYADDKPIRIGEEAGANLGTNGQVTIVSGNRIKLTENDMNLSSFMDEDSEIPGLLFFSDYTAPELADRCDFDVTVEPIINMAGNSGSKGPVVYHWPGDLPKKPVAGVDYSGCPQSIDYCYIQSTNVFTGLIYAPNGRVATSGGTTTYIGAILSWTIDINGYDNVFVHNSMLFPSGNPKIYLEE